MAREVRPRSSNVGVAEDGKTKLMFSAECAGDEGENNDDDDVAC